MVSSSLCCYSFSCSLQGVPWIGRPWRGLSCGMTRDDHLRDRRAPLHCPVLHYIEQFDKRPNLGCFSGKLLPRDLHKDRDVCAWRPRPRDTGVGACKSLVPLWWTSSDWLIMLVYAFEQSAHPLLRRDWVEVAPRQHNAAVKEHFIMQQAKSPGELIGIYSSYDQIYFYSKWYKWCCEVDFE